MGLILNFIDIIEAYNRIQYLDKILRNMHSSGGHRSYMSMLIKRRNGTSRRNKMAIFTRMLIIYYVKLVSQEIIIKK